MTSPLSDTSSSSSSASITFNSDEDEPSSSFAHALRRTAPTNFLTDDIEGFEPAAPFTPMATIPSTPDRHHHHNHRHADDEDGELDNLVTSLGTETHATQASADGPGTENNTHSVQHPFTPLTPLHCQSGTTIPRGHFGLLLMNMQKDFFAGGGSVPIVEANEDFVGKMNKLRRIKVSSAFSRTFPLSPSLMLISSSHART
jgi:hypothetical protein